MRRDSMRQRQSPPNRRWSTDSRAFASSLLVASVVTLHSEAGAQSAEAPAPAASHAANRPPEIVELLPQGYDRESIALKVGDTLRLTLLARDPDGDPLTAVALGLPAGASFSAAEARFDWMPARTQLGDHVVLFRVSDGSLEATRALTIRVSENRAPVFFPRAYSVSVGQFGHLAFIADDADGDTLTYALTPAPEGSVFDPTRGTLRWRPGPDAVGPHRVRVSASDGRTTVAYDFEIDVLPAASDAWAAFFTPGLGAATYFPRESERWGAFAGASVSIALLSWLHRSDEPGPGLGKLYALLEFLGSTEDDVPLLFSYAAGFALAMERNPTRRFLVPIYGLEAGGLVHEGLGSPFQTTPYLGLELFAERGLFLALRGGYRVVPARSSRLSGPHVALSLEWDLW